MAQHGAAFRSTYSELSTKLTSVRCRNLITSILQEHASDQNVEMAMDFCLLRFREHRYTDTDAADVARRVEQLVQKLKVHSQLEAASFLELRHAAFQKCRLSKRHTSEPHAAVLRALLLLARRPTHVPLRMVRTLRAVSERKNAGELERRRVASEHAYERRALLALELRQIAEKSARDWQEAWLDAPVEPWELLPSAQATRAAPKRGTRIPHRPPEDDDDSSEELMNETDLEADEEQARRAAALASQQAKVADRFPQGLLPKPSWHSENVSKLDALAAFVEVSEQALVESILYMLMGCCGDLFFSGDDGTITWISLGITGISTTALTEMLEAVAVLGSVLQRMRLAAEVLQALQPSTAGQALSNGLVRLLRERGLSLQGLAQLSTLANVKVASSLAGRPDDRRTTEAAVLGRCWYALGACLEELLSAFESSVRQLQTSMQSAACREAQQAENPAPLSLLKLVNWARPRTLALHEVARTLDAALADVSTRAAKTEPADLAEAAGDALLTHLARAVNAEGATFGSTLLPNGSSPDDPQLLPVRWLGQLWHGAMRPILRGMDQWSTTGELYDPCGEMRDIDMKGSKATLLPDTVASGARQVAALQSWKQMGQTAEDDVSRRGEGRRWHGRPSTSEAAAWKALCSALPLHDSLAESCYRPLDVAVAAQVLAPAESRTGAEIKSLLAHVLNDTNCGLLCHLAALRSVALLEREDIAGPIVRHSVEHASRKATRSASSRSAATAAVQRELAVELSAALSATSENSSSGRVLPEGSSLEKAAKAERLCAQHLCIMFEAATSRKQDHEAQMSAFARKPASEDCCAAVAGLQLIYEAPAPLDRIIDARALQTYSQLMIFLLRVRHAQETLMQVRRSPFFGLCGEARRSWPPLRDAKGGVRSLVSLGRSVDSLCAEMSHVLGCLERYVRNDVLLDASRSLEGQLQNLAQTGQRSEPSEDGSSSLAALGVADVMEQARAIHAEFLERILQECFLATDLASILSDLQHLIGLVTDLSRVLATLEAQLRPLAPDSETGYTWNPAMHSNTSALEEMELDRPDAERAILMTNAEVMQLQLELQRGIRFVLQALIHSVARGTSHRVWNLCLQLDFNEFYTGGAR
eukprot:TRINITY_DN33811_c0_g1_i2.p1 TRINITY_DN33811_c0_g1~~TRINITY_DN33811_c0_g1_i2.p1  ORF type:complete len:1108 (+),score=205.68 TRINITY_DN33811_c0_g1_i2:57-3380(+)